MYPKFKRNYRYNIQIGISHTCAEVPYNGGEQIMLRSKRERLRPVNHNPLTQQTLKTNIQVPSHTGFHHVQYW
jgi:hypothetical protein